MQGLHRPVNQANYQMIKISCSHGLPGGKATDSPGHADACYRERASTFAAGDLFAPHIVAWARPGSWSDAGKRNEKISLNVRAIVESADFGKTVWLNALPSGNCKMTAVGF